MTLKRCEGVEVGRKYLLTGSYYKGKIIEITWINKRKSIFYDCEARRQVQGKVLSNNVVINTIANFLSDDTTFKNNFSGMKNSEIIKGLKSGGKEYTKEFIKRFGKLPKMSK